MRFRKIYDVKFDFFSKFDIVNFEKIPASVAFSIAIDPHKQVILIGINKYGKIQVSTLKLWGKLDVLMFPSGIDSFKESVLSWSNGKVLLRFVEMGKLESFDDFFGVKEAFVKIFMKFVLPVLFEDFHIGSRPESHVNNFELKFGAEWSESFGDEIGGGIGKDERDLFEFGNEGFGLPSVLNEYCTQCKCQVPGSDLII